MCEDAGAEGAGPRVGGATEKPQASAPPRTGAVKLEPPEAPPSEVQTACDVSQLYLDVRGLLRRHQGTEGISAQSAGP